MNTLQLHYTQEVLGISSVIQPNHIRSIYRIHSSIQAPTFLFFYTKMKEINKTIPRQSKNTSHLNKLQGQEVKHFIQKINQALKAPFSSEWIVEILHREHQHMYQIFDNLLIRFQPKGFVIFDPSLARQLIPKTYQPEKLEKIKCSIDLTNQEQVSIPGCVLNPIAEFMDTTHPSHVQKIKRQAWQLLKSIFSIKSD